MSKSFIFFGLTSLFLAFGYIIPKTFAQEVVEIDQTVNYIGEKKTEDKIQALIASSSYLFDEKEALKMALEMDKSDELISLLREISNKLTYTNNLLLQIRNK